jgi:Domain of unknown function (DUF4279)
MDVEEVILDLLGRLPTDPGVWHLLSQKYRMDLFCGLFLEASNRGFSLSAGTCRALADRGLEIGFDILRDQVVDHAPTVARARRGRATERNAAPVRNAGPGRRPRPQERRERP